MPPPMPSRPTPVPHAPPAPRASTPADVRGHLGEVVVTGGAGFLGSHLVEQLLREGHWVHVLDDLSSGSFENLAVVCDHPRLRLTIGSAADPAIAQRVCNSASAVFHLAGMVGVQRLAAEPLVVMQGNLRCTEVMLEAAAAARLPILIASSSEVYGQGPVPFRECDPVRPGSTQNLRGGYACAKAMGEWLALAHNHQQGLPVTIARLFNVVGPRQNGAYGMVLPRFLQQARTGQPITVFGDGSQTRCFGGVREIARALAQLLATPAARGQCVNVGSDREITVLQLAEIVRAALGSRSPIVLVPHDRVFPKSFVDPHRRVPSLDRLRELIGWVPEQRIESIVEELAAAEPSPSVQRALAARAFS